MSLANTMLFKSKAVLHWLASSVTKKLWLVRTPTTGGKWLMRTPTARGESGAPLVGVLSN